MYSSSTGGGPILTHSSSTQQSSLQRPSTFSFDSTPQSSSVIVSNAQPLPPSQPDLPERTPETPSFNPASNYYGTEYGFNYYPGIPFLIPFDMARQQTEGGSCTTTPTLPFLQDFNQLSQFSGNLTPINPQQPFSTQYPGHSVLPMGGTVQRRQGGRRPKEIDNMYDQDMDADEIDKKCKRRQRNKEAAARCRARRLQLMNELQDKTDHLKRENRQKSVQIDELRERVRRMHTFLASHDCKLAPEDRAKMADQLSFTNQIATISNIQASSSVMGPPPITSIPPVSLPQQNPVLIENNYAGQLRGAQFKRDSTDYQPQGIMEQSRKRPANDANMFNAPMEKQLKTEPEADLREKTLTQINQQKDELERPGELNLMTSSASSSGSIPLATPSRDPGFSGGFTPGFAGGNFLNQSTGYTPIGQPNIISSFTGGAVTPSSDLKML